MSTAPHAAEAARQQALLAALWPAQGPHADAAAALAALVPHLDPAAGVSASRGLQAYRVTGQAVAERALGAAFPVLRALVGDEAFAGLSRAYWLAHPPERGDLAFLGESLPAFVQADPQLADAPYLGDVARLELAIAHADGAADASLDPASLGLLAGTDPDALHLVLAPGAALRRSAWPAASLWRAHDAEAARTSTDPVPADEDAMAAVRERFAAGEGESAFTWRAGWRVHVRTVDDAEAAFLAAVLDGRSLSFALDAAEAAGAFAFDAWLARALADGFLLGASAQAPPG